MVALENPVGVSTRYNNWNLIAVRWVLLSGIAFFSACATLPQKSEDLFEIYRSEAFLIDEMLDVDQDRVATRSQNLITIVKAIAPRYLQAYPYCRLPIEDMMYIIKRLESMTAEKAAKRFHAVKSWDPPTEPPCADLAKMLLNPWRLIVMSSSETQPPPKTEMRAILGEAIGAAQRAHVRMREADLMQGLAN